MGYLMRKGVGLDFNNWGVSYENRGGGWKERIEKGFVTTDD